MIGVGPKTLGMVDRAQAADPAGVLAGVRDGIKQGPAENYLDLFAGQAENVSRETGREILGSVHRALSTDPPFTRIALFELPAKAEQLAQALRAQYPHRPDIKVYPGDCNEKLDQAMADLADVRWAPTFAFVDQHDNEIKWATLEKLAQFRRGKTKTEMWILIGPSFYRRGLELRKETMNVKYAATLTEMYGTEAWMPIVEGARQRLLSPRQAYDEFTNLLRWRLERDLDYRWSHAFTMKNTGGQDLYDMVYVSDHYAGDKIMRNLYGRALGKHEEMRQQALARRRAQRERERNESRGQFSLFGDSELELFNSPDPRDLNRRPESVYKSEPPREPFALP